MSASVELVEVTRITGLIEIGEFVGYVSKKNQNYRSVVMMKIRFTYASLDGDFVVNELHYPKNVRFIIPTN